MTAATRSSRTYGRILDEAEALFAARGYRRTRVQEVSAAVGVSDPAMYRYFRGKEALFDQVLRRAAALPGEYVAPTTLPVPNPAPGATESFLRDLFRRTRRLATLEVALAASAPGPAGARAELAGIAEELFDLGTRYHVGARIMRASAIEAPELGAIYELEFTTPVAIALEEYFVRRAASEHLFVRGPVDEATVVFGNLVGVHAAYGDLVVPIGNGSIERTKRAVVTAALAMFEPQGGYR